MAHIRYDIVPRLGGWSIACDGVVGRPYLQRDVAIGDATWVADLLSKTGEDVGVYLDGEPVDIEPGKTAAARRH